MTNQEFTEIRIAFAIETGEMLAEMEASLLALEAHPAVADDFNRLFRAVHTIKGSAGIVGADQVERFCHDLEHLLVRIREHELALSQELFMLFLQSHDLIGALVEAYRSAGEGQPLLPSRHDQLLGLIHEWLVKPPQTSIIDEEPVPANESRSYLQQFADDPVGIDQNPSSQQIVRIDAVKLDQLINLVVELVTASSELDAHVKRLGDNFTVEASSIVTQLVKKIQERAMVFRMVPVGDLFRRFNRMLHDLSASSGKQIQLQISGGDTELDKVMAERFREPLLHLVRNAIDHGIELPGDRIKNGKPANGTIRLNAFQETGHIVIEVKDDGRGISREKVLMKAVERGLIRPLEVAERDALLLIFEPGFSTLEQATMLSGRGVGMDAVKRAVEELRGKIDIDSEEGKGTTIRVRLPLSLALIDGFMVTISSSSFIIPMELVEETIDLAPADLFELERRGYLNVRGAALPCIDLRETVHVVDQPPASRFAVVVRSDGRRIGLAVDSLIGEVKAVIKPLGRLYRNVRVVSGATILGDGTIALILDVPELLRSVPE